MNQFHKVYVDEVQDYTQVEILLFFVLGGAGNLFLAGDPAQNVARGVEFRFADIRKVGYYVAGYDEGKKELIPQVSPFPYFKVLWLYISLLMQS